MPGKNLWGDLSALETVRTPKELLTEQASTLTEATEGVLRGKVDRQGTGPRFAYDLDVYVPVLNNYTYTILTITHELGLYPVRVTSSAPQRSEKCDNEEQFLEVLESILSSKDVKFILSRLMSQAS